MIGRKCLLKSATKTKLFNKPLQTGEIWKCLLCVLVWTENVLKTKLLENDDVTIITWLPCPSFQNHRCLLRFKFFQRRVDEILDSSIRSVISFLDSTLLLYLEAPLSSLCFWPHPATGLQLHSHSCSVAVQISSFPCCGTIKQICIVMVTSACKNIKKDGANGRENISLFTHSKTLSH